LNKSWTLGRYQNLTDDEIVVVGLFFTEEDGDKHLASYIENNHTLSNGFRRFIADIVTGRVARKLHKTALRDFKIYNTITKLISLGLPLRDNRNQAGAVSLVGDALKMDPESVLKAYQRYKNHVDSCIVTVDENSISLSMTR